MCSPFKDYYNLPVRWFVTIDPTYKPLIIPWLNYDSSFSFKIIFNCKTKSLYLHILLYYHFLLVTLIMYNVCEFCELIIHLHYNTECDFCYSFLTYTELLRQIKQMRFIYQNKSSTWWKYKLSFILTLIQPKTTVFFCSKNGPKYNVLKYNKCVCWYKTINKI